MAQKKVAKKIRQFPQISRIFTALAVLVVLTILVFNIGYWVRDLIKEREAMEQERNELLTQRRAWEGVVVQYPDYRDAYYQLAVIEYRLGNRIAVREYLKKVLELDPNFKPAKEIETLLGGF